MTCHYSYTTLTLDCKHNLTPFAFRQYNQKGSLYKDSYNLHNIFGDRMIFRSLWPVRVSDVRPRDDHLRKYEKQRTEKHSTDKKT